MADNIPLRKFSWSMRSVAITGAALAAATLLLCPWSAGAKDSDGDHERHHCRRNDVLHRLAERQLVGLEEGPGRHPAGQQ